MDISPALLAVTGAATIGWAGVVAALALRAHWQSSVRAVVVANVVASAGLLAFGARHKRAGATVLLAGAGTEVAAFAAVEAKALD